MILGSLQVETFLKRYWQRRPLLIKKAFPAFADPLTPEELAGIACEADADARLVFTRKRSWDLRNGPFTEADFTSLPDSSWTLLVQAVDQWLPAVRRLLGSVPFIPSWRVDDVMISYATPGGGVGPHFDYYDVFLVQGQGSRVWKTGQRCGEDDLLRTGSGLKLLKEFHTEHEWLLEAGDVLYVPPGTAHWGVSRDCSLCYSIGFRAPALSDMLLGYSDYLAERAAADCRFTDPVRKQPLRPGEIDCASVQCARSMLLQAMEDEASFARWFGCRISEPRNSDAILPPARMRDPSAADLMLTLNPASRLCWQRSAGNLLVFSDGVCSETRYSPTLAKLIQTLARPGAVISSKAYQTKAAQAILARLLRQGTLIVAKAPAHKRKSR